MVRGDAVIGDVVHYILMLHGVAALTVIFAFPLLESAVFAGFVFPGEIAVLLGGVLASQHRVSLAAAMAAASAGAIAGDTIGYEVGKRWGRRLIHMTAGRLVKRRHLDRGERYLAERGGKAVFAARFTAALRVLVPGLAGTARMPYRTFALYNVTGGIAWAVTTTLIGYLAGTSLERAEHLATRTGLAVLGLVLVFVATGALVRRLRRSDRRPFAIAGRWRDSRLRRRLPRQAAWVERRLDPAEPTGLPLTTAVAVAALGTWTFAALAQDVREYEEIARLDPWIMEFAQDHRVGGVTEAMDVFQWLGSWGVLTFILAVASVTLLRRRDRLGTAELWVAFAGAGLLNEGVRVLVGRPPPPVADMLAQRPAYPSGHAAMSIAAWGVLALLLARGHPLRVRAALLGGAAAVILLVGVSQVYLGAHWFTDVLGGYILGGTWLALAAAFDLVHRRRDRDGSQAPPAVRR